MSRADDYLKIPEDESRWLGGLRWCASGEAVESTAVDPEIGCTFAMGPEIALFLEGYAGAGRLIGFGFMLHLLHLLGVGIRGPLTRPVRRAERLAFAFREAGRPLRNAGALCAWLCRDVPPATDPPGLAEILFALKQRATNPARARLLDLRSGPAEVPPLSADAFESTVLDAFAPLEPDAVRHWMRHGCAPAGAVGAEIARLVPRTLGAALAMLEQRPRLASATPMVACLDGALALPPRRLAPAALPTGGYADVANRGLPEQILPAQLALDADEFVRRFAERELLYYHREEPRTPAAEEVVVLFDQGVRTWGDVRVVLAAALMALARQADRRGIPFRIAATSNEGDVIDPRDLDDEALGTLLESSDLSPHPGLALERVLEARSERARDVVLLTHPRGLAEADVAAAARRVRPEARLFAIAVERDGAVALSELRRGIPVVHSRCRVEIHKPRWSPAPRSAAAGPAPAPWKGDVESPGFPFRLGALSPIHDRLFDLDDSGERLLLAGQNGLLHTWMVDGGEAEMLPRALHEGKPTSIEAVVGVAGGFVVAGRTNQGTVAAHYDFPTRTCTTYNLGSPGVWCRELSYVRHLHSVVVYNALVPFLALDLGRGPDDAFYPPRGKDAATSARAVRAPSDRAVRAYAEAREAARPLIVAEGQPMPPTGRAIRLHRATGTIDVQDDAGRCRSSTPQDDGRPTFQDCRISHARSGGDVIAAVVGDASRTQLVLFSVVDARPLAAYPLGAGGWGFALLRDGRRVVRKIGDRHLEVRDISGGAIPRLVTPKGRSHQRLDVELGDSFFIVTTGKHFHLIRWDNDRLATVHSGADAGMAVSLALGPERRRATVWASGTQGKVAHDRRRFLAACSAGNLTVLVDIIGQVVVLDAAGELVCMFYVFRDQLAGWMPDGTRFGPAPIIGGRPSPNASERIVAALRAASQTRKEATP